MSAVGGKLIAQKKLHASPIFNMLKVNSSLYTAYQLVNPSEGCTVEERFGLWNAHTWIAETAFKYPGSVERSGRQTSRGGGKSEGYLSRWKSIVNEIQHSSTHVRDDNQLKKAFRAPEIAKNAPFCRSYIGT
nr:unnamed protein product [Callosobruchus analis]